MKTIKAFQYVLNIIDEISLNKLKCDSQILTFKNIFILQTKIIKRFSTFPLLHINVHFSPNWWNVG